MDSSTTAADPAPPSRTAILVLGMHRSGTSAFTRLISQLGAALPDHLIPESESNEAGFWESSDIVALDDELLALAGGRWDDWRRWSIQDLDDSGLQPLRERARDLLQRDFGASPRFVLKDPRFCRLLDFWLPVLDGFADDIRCVLPLRHPLEVADSLRQRDALPAPLACVIWLRHVLEAERHSRALPRLLLRYDSLLEAPQEQVAALARWLGWADEADAAQVAGSLHSRLRHHAHDDAALQRHPDIADWVRAAWQALLALEAGDESALAELDRIRGELDLADAALGPVLAQSRAECDRLRAAEAALGRELRKSEEQIAHLERRAETQARELGRRRGEAEALGGKIEEQKQELGRRRARIETLDRQVADQGRELERRREELARREELLRARDAEIASQGRELAQRFELIQAGHREAQLLREERDTLRARSTVLEAQQLRQREQNLHRADRLRQAAAQWSQRRLALPPGRLHGERLRPHQRWHLWRHARALLVEGGFDTAWYLMAYPDIDCAGQHPVWHWILRGWREARRPRALFETAWYLRSYPDVDSAGMDPLQHYLLNGASEGRRPGILQQRLAGWFDPGWYLEQYPDVAGRMDPLAHYLLFGGFEGRNPGPYFDSEAYLARYPDVASAGINPLEHYLLIGESEGRLPPRAEPGQVRPFRDSGPGLVDPASPEAAALQLTTAQLREAWALLADAPALTFSVIMPTWNRREVVGRAIDSVLRQSWTHWELIVCDDGSSDGTAEALRARYPEQIAQGRLKILDLPHGGVSAARNAGLRAARGDWVAYLDSDNRWHPHYLLMVAAASRGAADSVDSTYTCLHVDDEHNQRQLIRCREFDYAALCERNYIDLNVFAHARGLYEQLGGFDESLSRLVDWDLILRYGKVATPRFIPLVLADYFIAASLSNITLTAPLEENDAAIRRKIAADE